jgi:hypothetical protein
MASLLEALSRQLDQLWRENMLALALLVVV